MTQQEQLIAWLNDAYATEKAIERILHSQLADLESYPGIHLTVAAHRDESRVQAERVKRCIEALGSQVSAPKSMLGNMMAGVEALGMKMMGDRVVKMMLMNYATEHAEIALYTALASTAEALGYSEIAEVATLNLQEEQRMAEWLLEQIPQVTLNYLEMEPVMAR
jgi:ferritin-like metal-binding protein YciE